MLFLIRILIKVTPSSTSPTSSLLGMEEGTSPLLILVTFISVFAGFGLLGFILWLHDEIYIN